MSNDQAAHTSLAAHTSIDPATSVGLLSLTVADLDRSLAYYTDIFGFKLLERGEGVATLGAGDAPLLLLTERAGAKAFPHDRPGYTGLYHFAVLVPTRADLGRWLRHWLELGLPVPGQGDHLVSEALYITDPDGNGIEIYRDRPRDKWTWDDGRVRMAADPVDLRGVLAEGDALAQPWNGLPAGTRLGHMHLQIADIATARAFYVDTLGFDLVAEMPSALFVSAGGYHHHIGMNTWHSRGAGPTPDDTAGLRFFTIDFATEEARAAVLARLATANVPYAQHGDIALVNDPFRTIIALRIGSPANAQAAQALRAAAEAQ
jgi:catechol 2,3-dioxygenase